MKNEKVITQSRGASFTVIWDIEYSENDVNIPADQCELGKCVQTDQGILWCLKRYTDGQIVLQGCGDDEYYFGREDKRTEIFYFCGK